MYVYMYIVDLIVQFSWHAGPGQIRGLAAVLSALAAARESLTLGPGVATTVATLLRAAAKSLLVEDGDLA